MRSMMANLLEMAIFASGQPDYLEAITLKNTRRRHPSSLASILSISSVLVMLALFLFVFRLGQQIENRLREDISLLVLFHLDTEETEVMKLKSELESRESVKEVHFTSGEEGLKEMTQDLQQDIENTLGFNPIPSSLEVHLNSEYANQVNLARLKLELGRNERVREVSYQTGILEQIEANARKILTGIGVLAVIFALISITLINSTVRLDLYSQRFLIRSMQLVGATRWFIVKPFIGRAILNGVLATLIAIPVLAGLGYLLWIVIPDIAGTLALLELAAIGGIILVCGVLLTVICSYFATRKYLKLKLEELY